MQLGCNSEKQVTDENIYGIYQGVSPCPECAGIVNTFYIYPDGQIVRIYEYLDQNNKTHTANRYWQKGKYQITDSSNILKADFGEIVISYKYEKGKIIQLDDSGEAYTNPLAYTFAKTGAF
jgi:hypothetical protein